MIIISTLQLATRARLSRTFALALVAVSIGLAEASPADEDCSNAPPAQALALSRKAADLLEREGPERAFLQFMDPRGAFFPRDLYVFVVDFDGTMWVNGAFPQAIGSNALGATDDRGTRYIQAMLQIARDRGEGQVEYRWFNPCTGDYTDKLTFFKRVGRFVVAVGAYRNGATLSA